MVPKLTFSQENRTANLIFTTFSVEKCFSTHGLLVIPFFQHAQLISMILFSFQIVFFKVLRGAITLERRGSTVCLQKKKKRCCSSNRDGMDVNIVRNK